MALWVQLLQIFQLLKPTMQNFLALLDEMKGIRNANRSAPDDIQVIIDNETRLSSEQQLMLRRLIAEHRAYDKLGDELDRIGRLYVQKQEELLAHREEVMADLAPLFQ